MCGIAGYLSTGRVPVTMDKLHAMADIMQHRGPDGSGFWIEEGQRIGLAHRRLSILDLSERGAQPMHYANGRYSITFNGEIYNYVELRSALEQNGARFITGTDTEVVLAAFAEKGPACLQDFDGMFAFAIWDALECRLFCARDRFGEKPFFYVHTQGMFAFASEMKALFASGCVRPAPDMDALVRYLAYNTIVSSAQPGQTSYEGVMQLRPAHYCMVSAKGEMRETCYWRIGEQRCDDRMEVAAEKVFHLLKQSVSRRLRADVPVGSSLSGGLDSSSIVLLIDQLKGEAQTQNTFSARFANFEKDEGRYMEAVIEKCRVTPHFTWPGPDELAQRLGKIFWHQEEPFGSASIVVQEQVMALARQHGTIVLLDGQGPDEMLGGYFYFYTKYYLRDLYRRDRAAFHRERAALRAVTGLETGVGPLMAFRAFFPGLANVVKGWAKKAAFLVNPEATSLQPDLWRRALALEDPFRQSASVEGQLYQASFSDSLPQLLRYADRNSMAHSLEVRLPYLERELVEYLFSLPIEMKLHSGWTKYILRKAMEPLLPPEITWRRDKIGYEPPQRSWLEHPVLQEKLADAVALLKQEKIIRKPVADSAWRYLMVAEQLRFAKGF